MSELMLDDKNAMDDINPFVDPSNFFPPGTSKHAVDFKKYEQAIDEPEEEYKSPACDILSKGVGRPGYSDQKCSLHRPLLPGRNLDTGFTPREKIEINGDLIQNETNVKHQSNNQTMTMIAIAINRIRIAIL
tara:strand:+ start:3208 stop:3603 length:396 start_codon:yes stop_codon:yes gene_type:complete